MTDHSSRKVVQRETASLKREVDEALEAFSERLLKDVPVQYHPTMEEVDAVMDDVAANIIRPIARYVKRQLRRSGVCVDETCTSNDSEVDSDDLSYQED